MAKEARKLGGGSLQLSMSQKIMSDAEVSVAAAELLRQISKYFDNLKIGVSGRWMYLDSDGEVFEAAAPDLPSRLLQSLSRISRDPDNSCSFDSFTLHNESNSENFMSVRFSRGISHVWKGRVTSLDSFSVNFESVDSIDTTTLRKFTLSVLTYFNNCRIIHFRMRKNIGSRDIDPELEEFFVQWIWAYSKNLVWENLLPIDNDLVIEDTGSHVLIFWKNGPKFFDAPQEFEAVSVLAKKLDSACIHYKSV